MKPVFNINEFTNRRCLMRCESKEESDFFRRFLHNAGRVWFKGDSYLNHDRYREGNFIYYEFGQGRCGIGTNDNDYKILGYEIIYFDDFLWEGFNSSPIENSEEIDNFLNLFCIKG